MTMIGSTDCWLLALLYEEQAVKYSNGSVARGAGEINTPLPIPLPACFFNSPSSRANELVLKAELTIHYILVTTEQYIFYGGA
jgi:hypothetical protein